MLRLVCADIDFLMFSELEAKKLYYELIYDYTEDGYVLIRSRHRDDLTKKIGISRRYDWEIFSVTRTSKQCYRCMYTDVLMGEVKYFTAQSPEKLLGKMAKISTMSDKVSGK